MTDLSRTHQELIEKNALLKQKILDLNQLGSDHKKLKEALRESEDKYRTLIKKIQTAVVIHGPDTQILSCNPMAEELLGLTEDQLLGKTAIDKDWHFLNADGSVMDIEDYPVNQVLSMRQPLINFIAGVCRPNKKPENKVWVLINANPVIVNDKLDQTIVTFVDITDRKRAEEALFESERKYRNLYHYAHVGLFETGLKDAKIIACNQRYCDLAGFPTVDDAIGLDTLHLYYNPSDREEVKKTLKKYGYIKDHVLQIKNRMTGEIFWVEFSARTNPSSEIIEGTLIEITKRKQAEDKIKESLADKELLLKEVYHRVKNNLQVVCSLLYLQSQNVDDPDSVMLLKESENRVRTMALIHEKLYGSKDLSQIDYNDYINSLVKHLSVGYAKLSQNIMVTVEAANIQLDIDTAIPCGLIINELVSNSFKHAFPPGTVPSGEKGEIQIRLDKDDQGNYNLMIIDNGVGFPSDFDITHTQSLGMQIVNTLVRQLDGTIQFPQAKRTVIEIQFNENKYNERM